MIEFECPHCHNKCDEKIDDKLPLNERVQSSDDLNADPKSNVRNKIELWYCFSCGNYFKVYYILNKITKLNEEV